MLFKFKSLIFSEINFAIFILDTKEQVIIIMRQGLLLMLAIALTGQMVNGFVVPSIDMSDATFEQCSFCDERSDRAGSRAVADALREYMTQNHINILLEQGNFLCTK